MVTAEQHQQLTGQQPGLTLAVADMARTAGPVGQWGSERAVAVLCSPVQSVHCVQRESLLTD